MSCSLYSSHHCCRRARCWDKYECMKIKLTQVKESIHIGITSASITAWDQFWLSRYFLPTNMDVTQVVFGLYLFALLCKIIYFLFKNQGIWFHLGLWTNFIYRASSKSTDESFERATFKPANICTILGVNTRHHYNVAANVSCPLFDQMHFEVHK